MPFLSLFNKKPIDFTFDQMEVLKNMEVYLRRKGDEEKDPVSKKSRYELADKIKKTDGFCHGFSLYFLDSIVKDVKDKDANYLHKHFSDLQTIAAFDPKSKLTPSLEAVFERVIGHVNWLQDPRAYHSAVAHSDIEILMEGEFVRDRCYYDTFSSLQSFQEFFRAHIPVDRPILIESSNHATALYRDGDMLYCRDPNDPLGLRKIYFNDVDHAAEFYYEQLKQLYPETTPFELPIKFIICKTTEQESCGLETYEDYVKEKMTTDPEFINRKGPDGTTALWQAIANGDNNAVKILLENGADPNVFRTNDKLSAFESTFFSKQFDVAEMLLSSPDFDANFKDLDDVTPLILAVRKENTKLINELLKPEKKANINHMTKDGETALHIALKRNNVALVDKLLARDADILVKKEGGKSPLEIVLDKCLDDKKEKRDKINDIAMLENLLSKSPNTSELREACFDILLKDKNLFLPKNQDAAFLLMDKHTGFDLFLCVSSFLSVPSTSKVANKTSWTSMFKKQPVENDAIFEKMLQEKINRSDLEVNSPTVLNDMIVSVLEDCAKQSLYFSKDFQSRLDFTTNYLQHRAMLEQFQPKAIESQNIKSS